MTNIAGALDAGEVETITRLVESLDRSSCDFLQVEIGDIKLTIGKGAPPMDASVAREAVATGTAAVAPLPVDRASVMAAAAPGTVAAEATAEDAGVAITAPIMGRFYAKPEPAAAPFVTVGSEVEEGTTVALIEVMKMFTPIEAGVRGIVTELCVPDAEFVEYGQTLFWVRSQ